MKRKRIIYLHQVQYFILTLFVFKRTISPFCMKVDGNIFIKLFQICTTYDGFVFVFVWWCPCMAINASVQHNGGFLPGIMLLTQCYYHRGTRLNAMKSFSFCSLPKYGLPPKRFGIFFPLTEGCLEGLDAFRFFFKAVVKFEHPRIPAFQPFMKPVSYFLRKQFHAVQCLYQL